MKVTSETARVNAVLRDTAVVELALPAYMMAYMVEATQKSGFILRADVIAHLGRAAVLPLTRIAEASVSLMARKITDAAAELLRELNPDDPRHGLYCLTMFVLMLVDEELFPDPRNQAVLVALLLLDDVKNDKPDVNGELPVWKLDEILWKTEAKKMLRRANLLGLYIKAAVQVPALH
jgi:hypothetical protein